MLLRTCPRCQRKFKAKVELCPTDGTPLGPPHDPLIGTVLHGRYELISRLGEGGTGVVYRARHTKIERDVALKLLQPELTLDPVIRERFLREARATSRLRHPNIVDITDCGTDQGRVFLVMELLEGRSLADAIARQRLPAAQALRVLADVADALGLAHDNGVVHRDIKPENVFLCESEEGPRVKVLDFGIARMFGEPKLTSLGQVFGTPEYMSPEQIEGRDTTPATDVYALGVLAYELMVGAQPYQGSLVELMMQHAKAPVPRVREQVPAVPGPLDELIASMMAKEASQRPGPMESLANTLRTMAGELEMVGEPVADERTERGVGRDRERLMGLLRERWSVLRAAAGVAYPEGAPADLADALRAVGQQLEHIPELERASITLRAEHVQVEQTLRESQDRLHRALRSLAGDLAAAQGRCRSLREALESAARTRATEETAVAAAWSALSRRVGPMDPHTADALAGLGGMAERVRALRRERAQRESEVAAAEASRDETAFQHQQLEASLRAVSEEGHRHLEDLERRVLQAEGGASNLRDEVGMSLTQIAARLRAMPAAAALIRAEAVWTETPGR